MLKHVFRPKRRKNGRVVVSRVYSGRFRTEAMVARKTVSLNVTDKDVATRMLDQIVKQQEREHAGLAVPVALTKAAGRPILEHADAYVADLRAKGRAAKYCRNVRVRLALLFRECNWQRLGDVSTDSFIQWRTKLSATLSGKTLNDYLSLARTFIRWCERQQWIASNPLRHLEPTDTRGRATLKRRALSEDELRRLVEVSGRERGLVYFFAARTGLRRSEIRALRWHDLNLDCASPFLMTRASTSKNRREQSIPLVPELVERLADWMPRSGNREGAVFPVIPKMPRFQKDLDAAGIPRCDTQDRIVDFHALRYTWNTFLQINKVSLRMAQSLMRHSDPKLTSKVYLDESKLPLGEALRQLPRLNAAFADTHGRTPNQGAAGHSVSQVVTVGAAKTFLQPLGADVGGHGKSLHGAGREMVRGAGFEPATPSTQPVELQQQEASPAVRDTHGRTLVEGLTCSESLGDTEIESVVNAWPTLPEALRRAVLAIVESAQVQLRFGNTGQGTRRVVSRRDPKSDRKL